jgi:hypothetical protein
VLTALAQSPRKRPAILRFYEEFDLPPSDWDSERLPHESGTKDYRSYHKDSEGRRACQRITRLMKNSYIGDSAFVHNLWPRD